MRKLTKPRRTSYHPVLLQAYASECDTLYVQSTNQCLSCHPNPHSKFKVTTTLGVGVNVGVGTASIGFDNTGKLIGALAATTPGGGAQGEIAVTYDPTPGPQVVVQGSGSLSVGDPLQTYAAPADNTRVAR